LNMAQVQLRQSQLDLEKASIKAPFDGGVLEKTIEKGQHVVIGQQLGRVYKDGDLDVEVRIPIEDFKWLPDEAGIEDRLRVEIAFARDKEQGPTWSGRVARVKAQMDERTRTLPVVIEVDRNPPDGRTTNRGRLATNGLRPGMCDAVSDGQLKVMPVNVLRRFKDLVYIESGLESGDLVVKSPLSVAVDGMPVRIKK